MIATAPRVSVLPLRDERDEPVSLDGASFGSLLKHYRLAGGLSQEALADRANLSVRAISALERGERHAPYSATVRALATALDLSGSEGQTLEAAVARSRAPRAASSLAGESAALPLSPTPLLGRASELTTAQELLQSEAVRLLTVTGPGGVGKTRLALEVARALQTAFPDGVWFVDLARLRDPALMLPTLARELDVHERGGESLLASVQAHLQEQRLLLVLDNFEQVISAAPLLAELLSTCPGLKLLVTSRTRLRLRWEHTLPLLPLETPDPELPTTPEALAPVPAVALFVERAQASDPTFTLTPENASAVATLCRHLDGLPLALELAAARANVLTPAAMLAWAEHPLPVLSWDAPDLPERQQSLRAALAWSYALLPPAEQALFRRLGVFPDGWTLEAATAIAQPEALGLDPLGGLSALVDASLVWSCHTEDGELRFHWLEAVREFSREQLDASGEREAVARQHAAYYLALAERAAPALDGPEQDLWLRRLHQEHDNLRTALAWAARHDDAETELRLAGSLAYFWWNYGYVREGQAWLEDALARSPERRDALRQQALAGVGLLTIYLGDHARGTARLEEALALARELGDGRAVVEALGVLIRAAWAADQPERVPTLAAELESARALAEPWNLGFALRGLGLLAQEAGDLTAATGYLEEALDLCRDAGNQHAIAHVLGTLALVAHAQGGRAQATERITESLQIARALGRPRAIAWPIFAAVRVAAGRSPAGVLARLIGAADALRSRAGFPLSSRQQAAYDRVVAAVRADLGEDAYAAGWAAGRAMVPDQVVAEALAAVAASLPVHHEQPAAPKARSRELLSAREQEVLPLVAEGFTNREIAERLVISESTAKYHLTSLLNKLGADNRTQAVAHATQQGLL